MSPFYTVLGLWIDGEPVVAGIVAGAQSPYQPLDGPGDPLRPEPWVLVVEADDPDMAARLAVPTVKDWKA